MNQLQKEIYDMMPDDMPNVQAIETAKKVSQLFVDKNEDVSLWLSQALTLIDIAFAQGWNMAVENKIKFSDNAKKRFLSEWGENIGVIKRGLESISQINSVI